MRCTFILCIAAAVTTVPIATSETNQTPIASVNHNTIPRNDLSDGPGRKTIDAVSIHPEKRQTADPVGGKTVPVNPPRLLWPCRSGQETRYKVVLAPSPEFNTPETIHSDSMKWAFYNPHRKLKAGQWYWKYAVINGDSAQWHGPYRFIIPEEARVFETPTASTLVKSCPNDHPRVLMQSNRLSDFRKTAAVKAEAGVLISAADKLLNKKPTDPSHLKVDENIKDPEKALAYLKSISHRFTRDVKTWIRTLNQAYLLTGDEKYAKQAIDLTLNMTQWDTSKLAGDFADGAMLISMALTYDSCYERLSQEQRETLLTHIRPLGKKFYGHFVNRLEGDVFDNHVWQHTLRYLTFAGFATLGELPEADEWIRYCYGVWLARAPGLGGIDGAWHNGDSYFHVNIESLVYIPVLYRNLVGLNLFDQPWYDNVIHYVIYSQPPRSKSAGFGSSHELKQKPSDFRVAFADVIAREKGDRFAARYVADEIQDDEQRLLNEKTLMWYRLQSDRKPPETTTTSLAELPKSRAFRDTGIAMMHSRLSDIPHNTMLSFRSSPYGCTGHALANQNAFNIFYGGQDIFYSTGYRIHFNDPHNLLSYRNTRAHNTVMIDGLSQQIGVEGYGWIARALDGEAISYVVGDASNAYGPIVSDIWLERMSAYDVEPTVEYGFGDAGMKTFRRHIALLHPSTFLIYDELEASRPVTWRWMLHSRNNLRIDAGKNEIFSENDHATAKASLFGSPAIVTTLTDQFFSPAINWKKRKDTSGNLLKCENQWHSWTETAEKARSMRYLAVIQISDKDTHRVFAAITHSGNGTLEVDGWTICAELDTSKAPALLVKNKSQTALLMLGHDRCQLGKASITSKQAGSSLLAEIIDGKPVIKECVDELPEAAR